MTAMEEIGKTRRQSDNGEGCTRIRHRRPAGMPSGEQCPRSFPASTSFSDLLVIGGDPFTETAALTPADQVTGPGKPDISYPKTPANTIGTFPGATVIGSPVGTRRKTRFFPSATPIISRTYKISRPEFSQAFNRPVGIMCLHVVGRPCVPCDPAPRRPAECRRTGKAATAGRPGRPSGKVRRSRTMSP